MKNYRLTEHFKLNQETKKVLKVRLIALAFAIFYAKTFKKNIS
jgi:hypothetical protein